MKRIYVFFKQISRYGRSNLFYDKTNFSTISPLIILRHFDNQWFHDQDKTSYILNVLAIKYKEELAKVKLQTHHFDNKFWLECINFT